MPGINFVQYNYQRFMWDLIVVICKMGCFPMEKLISDSKYLRVRLIIFNFGCLVVYVDFVD